MTSPQFSLAGWCSSSSAAPFFTAFLVKVAIFFSISMISSGGSML
jgi:hypothetical protein